jgi:RHS repeat-associated protein
VFFTGARDLEVAAVGPPLQVSRLYNTSYISSGLTGPGWTWNMAIRLTYSVYLYAAPSTYQKEADIRMPDSRLFTFTENPDGVTYTPPSGRHDTLLRQPDGTWILTIQNSRSVWLFNQDGSLASITDEFSNIQSWAYDGGGHLQRVTDVISGRYLDVYFGADGRLSAVQDSVGRLVQYTYNTNGSLASVTDPLNRVTTYTYSQGRFGPILTQIKDHWNRVVATMTYDGSDKVTSYNENGETYTYDYSQVAMGQTFKIDSQGNRFKLSYNSAGYVTDWLPPDLAATHTDYNADGSIQQSRDEKLIWTTYTYDSQGRVTSVTRNATQNGPRSEYTYDSIFPDKVTAVTVKNPSTNQVDPNWQSWQYDYYQQGDPAPGALHHVYRIQSDGVTRDTVATYVYDAHGRITQQATASGAQTDYAYYPNGDLWTVTGPANNDLGTRPVTTYAYDTLGRVTSVTDPLGHVTTTTYDAVGRVLTVTLPKPTPSFPVQFTTTYSYDSWDAPSGLVFTTITDPNGKITRQGHDQYGRLAKSIDALGNTTTYTYTRDVLTSITDANNNVTTYTYDVHKRLTRTTFPDASHEDYGYFDLSLLGSKTDRKGQNTTYSYDGLKRLTQKSPHAPSSGAIDYTYTGQRLTLVRDTTLTPLQDYTFTYDPSYRVTGVTEGPRGTVNYVYTPDDRIATMTVSGGPTTTYAYYPDGSLDTIAWSPVAGQFKYAYTLNGQYQTISFPNGQTRGYSYDDQGRLSQLANLHPTAGTLAAYAYGYDIDPQTQQPTLLGQRTSMSLTVPSQGLTSAQSTYLYDADYQLTRANYPAPAPYNGEVHAWTYDALGNRLTNTVNGVPQTYTYFKNGSNPLNGQRLQSDSVNTYTYTPNGNTLMRNGSGGNFTFSWDYDDRMTSISGAATASYIHDYQGRRTSKTVSGSTTTYLYDGLNLIRASGSSAADYLFGPGIDEPLAMSRGGNIYFYAVDGLGSVNLVTDTSGAVQDAYLYDAWGVIKSQAGTLANDFGYTAREFAEAGLWYYRARYYQPAIGRFLSRDPFGQRNKKGEWYAYADSRPGSLIDSLGLFSISPNCSAPPFGPRFLTAVQNMCDKTMPGTPCHRALQNISAALGGGADDLPSCIQKGCHGGGQRIACDPCEGNCGVTPPLRGAVIIIGGAKNPNCPVSRGYGWGPTVFHESLHACGFFYEPSGNTPQGSWFRYAEQACYGWRDPAAPPIGHP